MRGVATDVAEYELVIRARRAVTPEGVRPVTVAVRGGRIAALAGPGAAPDAVSVVDLPGHEVLLPGLMATGPAAQAGLPGKGAIAAGRDADLVAFDDTAEFTVDPARLHHRHPVTPYAGRTLTGVVRRTWLRGQDADAAPAGRLLTRP